MTHASLRFAFVLFAFAFAGCTNNNITAPSPIPASATIPTTNPSNTIEFRVTGNVGNAPVTIKYSDPIDGITIVAGASLPYISDVKLTQSSSYLSLEASVNITDSTLVNPLLQVKIVTNGTIFQEDYAAGAGIGILDAQTSGTWHQ